MNDLSFCFVGIDVCLELEEVLDGNVTVFDGFGWTFGDKLSVSDLEISFNVALGWRDSKLEWALYACVFFGAISPSMGRCLGSLDVRSREYFENCG